MTYIDDASLALACACLATRGEARAAAQDLLCAALRSGLGYALPDGTHCRTWREAYRAWTALARGAEPGKPGRPRRTDGAKAVTLSLSAQARAVLAAAPDGPSALVERLLTAGATPLAPPARPPER